MLTRSLHTKKSKSQNKKKKSLFEEFKRYLRTNLDTMSDETNHLQKDTYTDFLSSQTYKNFKTFSETVNTTALPQETKDFFRNNNRFYENICKQALSYKEEEKILPENYFKIDNKKILLTEKNWEGVFNLLLRLDEKYNEKTDIENDLTWKNQLRKAILKLDKEKDLVEIYTKPSHVSEKNYKENLLRRSSKNVQNYTIEKTYMETFSIIVKYFISIKNKGLTPHDHIPSKKKNLNYFLNKVYDIFIILAEKEKTPQENIKASLTNLQANLGGALLNLTSFFMDGLPHFTFDWKNKETRSVLKEIINLVYLNESGGISGPKVQALIKKLCKNIDLLDIPSKTLSIIIEKIIIEAYKDIQKSQYIQKLKEDIFSSIKMEPILKKHNATKIKIGHNFLNYLREIMPDFIGEYSYIKSSNNLGAKQKYSSEWMVEIKNCSDLFKDLCRINRPFLIHYHPTDKEMLKEQYNQAHTQRILNYIHYNINGFLTAKKSLLRVTKNYVDTPALLTFLYLLLGEFLIYEEKALFDLEDFLKKIPLTLSLYYLRADDLLCIYKTTNDEGKQILRDLVKLMMQFETQTELEKALFKTLFKDRKKNILHHKKIKGLWEKITGIKYSILTCLRESTIFSAFGFFYIPYFLDSRGRHYFNNKGLNFQSHYMIRGIVKPFSKNVKLKEQNTLNKINELIIKTAKKQISLLHASHGEGLHAWINKYNKNITIQSYQEEEDQLFKEQFLTSFIEDERDTLETTISFLSSQKDYFNVPHVVTEVQKLIIIFAPFIKSIKKLPMKMLELMSFMSLPFGKIDKIIELDATSSGLQMQAISLKSPVLSKASKLIEKDMDKDIYNKNKNNFKDDMVKIIHIAKLVSTDFVIDFEKIMKEIDDYPKDKRYSTFLKHMEPYVKLIMEDSTEIADCLNPEIEWFIRSYKKTAKKIIESLQLNKSPLTNTQIFRIRALMLCIQQQGMSILDQVNERDVWKALGMTSVYNSTKYGRINMAYDFIKKKIFVNNSYLLKWWADLLEDYFSERFQPTHLKDAKIFPLISNKISLYVKKNNLPISIENPYLTYVMKPLKYKSYRIALNSYKKELRSSTLNYKAPQYDYVTNSLKLDSQKIDRMFGATFCHMLDAEIVMNLLNFVDELNLVLKKKGILYEIRIDPNHDSFRSLNAYYLRPLIEYSYLCLIARDPFTQSFKNQVFYPELLKIIRSEISKKDQEEVLKELTVLGKNFVKL